MDKITALQVFAEVARWNNFTIAADNLNMSRTKATRYINDLEDWLNCRLFNRSTRNVSLTFAGEQHLSKAQKIIDLTTNLKNSSQTDTDNPKGKLRVSTGTAFGEAHFGQAIAEYLQAYPEVKIELIIDDKCLNLIESRIDIAIRNTNELDPSLIARPLVKAKAIVCASPEYLKKNSTPKHPQELINHNTLRCNALKSNNKWSFTKNNHRLEVPINSSLHSNEILVLSRATLAGAGIAKLPCFLAFPLILEGDLVQLFKEWDCSEQTVWATYISRDHQPATVRTFIDFMVEHFKQKKSNFEARYQEQSSLESSKTNAIDSFSKVS